MMYINPELNDWLKTLPWVGFEDIPAARAQSEANGAQVDLSAYPDVAIHTVALPRVADAPSVPSADAASAPPDSEGQQFGSEVLPDLWVRVIHRKALAAEDPVLIHIHGGGLAIGTPEYDDAENAELVHATGVTILSPDYRLAPEHPYPAGFHDVVHVFRALRAHQMTVGETTLEPERIGVMGHSAGGNLAAALALAARDHGEQLALQILFEPQLDARLTTPSMRDGNDMPVWNYTNSVLSWDYYLGGREPDAYASPALAAHLEGLPRTYIVANANDPFRDEDIDYARRLIDAGVPTELHIWPGTFHGSTALRSAHLTQAATQEISRVLRHHLVQEPEEQVRPE